MNGIPKLDALRSISLYGLSSITMNFEYDTDPYFARAAGVRAHPERRGARRRHARHVAALQPERPHLPLRAAEPRPLGAGAEDPRRTGCSSGSTARSRASPTTRASAARRCSTRCSSIRTGCSRTASRVPQIARPARRQQRQRRRRLLLAGRPVLLRARPRPGRSRSRTSATSSSRRTTAFPSTSRTSRTVAIGHAPRLGPVRLHAAERCRRGRDPDARRRAGAGRPEEGRGADRHAEQDRAAARREDRARTTTAPS